MEEIWQNFLTWLAQEQTQYWGSWLAVGLSILMALRIGLPQYAKVSDKLKEAAETKDRDGRIKRFSTKLERIKKYVTSLVSALRSALIALVPIVVIPLFVLVLLTLYSDWFFGTPSILTNGELPTGSPEYFGEMALFFIDQLSRGLLFDAMEVFDWRLSGIEANMGNTPYLSALLAFRMIVDIYVAGLVVLVLQAIYGISVSSLRLLNPFGFIPARSKPGTA